MIFNLFVGDHLLFNEGVETSPIYGSGSDLLVFTENVTHNIKIVGVNDRLGFNERINPGKIIKRNIIEFLHFQEVAKSKVKDLYVFEMLTFVEHMYRVRAAQDKLNFIETVVCQIAKVGHDTLTFTETATVKRTANIHVNESITFSEGAKVYKPSICYIGNPTPALGDNANVIFSCTLLDSTTISLTLPSPAWDNTESFDNQVAKNTTKGGDIMLFRDPQWTKKYELKYHWTHLYSSQIEAAKEFINRTVGLVVVLIDYENRVWNGIITSTGAPFGQKSIPNRTYDLTLELL